MCAGEVAEAAGDSPGGVYAGAPVAAAAARTLRACVPRVIAVVAPARDDAQRLLHALLAAEHANSHQRTGRRGRRHIDCLRRRRRGRRTRLADRAGDMPAIAASTINAVAAALADGAMTAAPFVGARRGHPVGFSLPLRGELLRLKGDQGAAAFFPHGRRWRLQLMMPAACSISIPGRLCRGARYRACVSTGCSEAQLQTVPPPEIISPPC